MATSILDELNRIREENAAKFNYDLRALFEHYKEIDAQSGRKHVSLPPQRTRVKSATYPEAKRPAKFTIKPDRIQS